MRQATTAGISSRIAAAALLCLGWLGTAHAQTQTPSLDELVSAVVRVKAFIDPEGRTTGTLGREREGSGVVIDSTGLVLTIGYLMLEAHSAELTLGDGRSVQANVVGYDHETGFGLLRAAAVLNLRPMPLGKSSELKAGDPVLVASFGGPDNVGATHVVARRDFAGSWEYLLENAIFTSPPHPLWSGAALINREGRLVGVGSLIVGDASGKGDGPGNMFVPIDRLPPILAELIADGRVQGTARPWLGLTIEPIGGLLLVARVVPKGPAEKAGVQRGDVVVGVDGAAAKDLADFYRKVWARGSAGVTVPVDVLQQNTAKRRIDIPSMSRYDHLKLKSTY